MNGIRLFLIAILIFASTQNITAQTSVFTYQGRLSDGTSAANGTYQMQFALYDDLENGNQIGATLTNPGVSVSNGAFTVSLNFTAPNAFDGTARYLEISVKKTNEPNYTTLTPRQPITSAPYSVRALTATTADTSTNTLNVDGTPAAQIVKEGDTRLTDERTPLAGSANYVQNRADEQPSTDFNVSGNGTANVFNARTQFNIAGNRAFFTGNGNVFAGYQAGLRNTTGNSNSFFGKDAGRDNVTGSENVFVGISAGIFNTGSQNTFVGGGSGYFNRTGGYNTYLGYGAGASGGLFGNRNTMIGAETGAEASNLEYATAIGAGAIVSSSNTLVLGRNVDTVQIPGTLSVNNYSADIVNAQTQFNLGGNRFITTSNFSTFVGISAGTGAGYSNAFFGYEAGRLTTGSYNSFFGAAAGAFNLTGAYNSFFGKDAGVSNTSGIENSIFGMQSGYNSTTGNLNSFFGNYSGRSNIGGSNNTIIGAAANVGSGNLNYATALGSGAVVTTSNTIVLGRPDGSDKIRIFGLGAAGATFLCRNSDNEIATCTMGGLTEENRQNKEEINALREQVKQQQIAIESLRKLVCASNPAAVVCQ